MDLFDPSKMMRTETGSFGHDTGGPSAHRTLNVPFGGRWIVEPEVAWLVVLVLSVYFSRLADLPVRGEESRRARVAVEMIESGDWIVPRLQGEIYLSRPPLQNWLIAVVGLLRGRVDDLSVRLPSAAATLLTVLLIYGYSRAFLSRAGAFLAAAAYATMGQVLELGRLGETEAVFALLLSGSLLVWHWGDSRNWHRPLAWGIAYALVALGTLTKGLQAPLYFVATISVFLLGTRRWRDLFNWSHLFGLLVFVAVWGAWQLPFYLEMGPENSWRIYSDNVAMRFADMRFTTILSHLLFFPLETVLGCLLPWSALLVCYLSHDLRKSLGPVRGHVLFLVCCLAVTFPSCWLTPGARPRYLMPLYPCFAPLIALVAERCWQSGRTRSWQKAWTRFLIVMAGIMVSAGLTIPLAHAIADSHSPLWQPGWFAVFYSTVAVALACVVLSSRGALTDRQRRAGVLAVAAFLGLTYTGVVTNGMLRSSVSIREQIGRLKKQMPDNVHLVSFGKVDHKFAYYYGDRIEKRPWPASETVAAAGGVPTADGKCDATYFCFQLPNPRASKPFGFDWEPVAVVVCDRNRRQVPKKKVIVGRRILTSIAGAKSARTEIQQAVHLAPEKPE